MDKHRLWRESDGCKWVRSCFMCAYVCDRESEREKERIQTHTHTYIQADTHSLRPTRRCRRARNTCQASHLSLWRVSTARPFVCGIRVRRHTQRPL